MKVRISFYFIVYISLTSVVFMSCSSNTHSFPQPGSEPSLVLLDDQIYDVWTPQSIDRDTLPPWKMIKLCISNPQRISIP
jgi:hypothetical protein